MQQSGRERAGAAVPILLLSLLELFFLFSVFSTVFCRLLLFVFFWLCGFLRFRGYVFPLSLFLLSLRFQILMLVSPFDILFF